MNEQLEPNSNFQNLNIVKSSKHVINPKLYVSAILLFCGISFLIFNKARFEQERKNISKQPNSTNTTQQKGKGSKPYAEETFDGMTGYISINNAPKVIAYYKGVITNINNNVIYLKGLKEDQTFEIKYLNTIPVLLRAGNNSSVDFNISNLIIGDTITYTTGEIEGVSETINVTR